MLGTKCGWLVKRNEQRVWQKRWCCVVPHTFLYYFEAGPQMEVKSDGENDDGTGNIHTYEAWSGGGVNINAFANLDQEALNLAVTPAPQRWVRDASIRSKSTPPYAVEPSQIAPTQSPNATALTQKVRPNTMLTIGVKGPSQA